MPNFDELLNNVISHLIENCPNFNNQLTKITQGPSYNLSQQLGSKEKVNKMKAIAYNYSSGVHIDNNMMADAQAHFKLEEQFNTAMKKFPYNEEKSIEEEDEHKQRVLTQVVQSFLIKALVDYSQKKSIRSDDPFDDRLLIIDREIRSEISVKVSETLQKEQEASKQQKLPNR